MPDMVLQIKNCARCGGDHADVPILELARTMAPPDINPRIVWTHFAPCPVNGQPIMISQVDPLGSAVATLHGRSYRTDV